MKFPVILLCLLALAVALPGLAATAPQTAETPSLQATPAQVAPCSMTLAEQLPAMTPLATPAKVETQEGICGGWTYAGCCGALTRYKRICQVGPDRWTEYKCTGLCFL